MNTSADKTEVARVFITKFLKTQGINPVDSEAKALTDRVYNLEEVVMLLEGTIEVLQLQLKQTQKLEAEFEEFKRRFVSN